MILAILEQSASFMCLYARSPGDLGGQNGQTNSHSGWVGRNVLLCSGHDSGSGISGMIGIFKYERNSNSGGIEYLKLALDRVVCDCLIILSLLLFRMFTHG